MNVRSGVNRYRDGIEAYDIASMLASMGNGTPYEFKLDENEAINGSATIYRFVRFDATPQKHQSVYFISEDDGIIDTEKANRFLVDDTLILEWNGVPYAIPYTYKTPADIAGVLPEDVGDVLMDVIKITEIWKANGGGTFEELIARQRAINNIRAESEEIGDAPTPPVEKETPAETPAE